MIKDSILMLNSVLLGKRLYCEFGSVCARVRESKSCRQMFKNFHMHIRKFAESVIETLFASWDFSMCVSETV